jgi:hypothetical protein
MVRKAWSGDLNAGFILVLQIVSGSLFIFFAMVGCVLIYDAWDTTVDGPEISANAQNLILTLSGGVLALLSSIVGRYFGKRTL